MKYLLVFCLCWVMVGNACGQIITTIAGTGVMGNSGIGGMASVAQLRFPNGVAVDKAGNIYITDNSSTVKIISVSGVISVFAGSSFGDSGDGGAATNAFFKQPEGIIADKLGNVYISDGVAHRIRKVNSSGVVTTIAGTGVAGYSGDGGPASLAQLNRPLGMFLDGLGNLYVNDHDNYRIRKIDTTGVITTIAGNGLAGYSGDGGPATAASIRTGYLISVDSSGKNIFIPDGINYRIRRVNELGTITTIAGTGVNGFSGEGDNATSAQVSNTNAAVTDNLGAIYITDGVDNHRIRKISSSGVITTIGGTGVASFGGDGGPATAAQINGPVSLAVNNNKLYFCDRQNHRVRMITLPATGINEDLEQKREGYITPNPSSGTFTLHLPNESCHIVITDVTGRKVREFYAKATTTLQLEAKAGAYIVNITTADRQWKNKLILTQ
jgi:trimeric autotransporter adhesin